jgi:hypothetical protein
MNKNTLLAIFIVAAIAIAGLQVARYLRERAPANLRLVTPICFRCEKCGHAFTLLLDDLVRQWKGVPVTDADTGDRAHCPACQARFSSVRIGKDDFARGDVAPATLKPAPAAPDRQKIGSQLLR